jgi:flagellar basal-body rod protein FlgF
MMDSIGYVALTRQSGLHREMQVVAHNIANLSTSGFRREGVVFAEHVRETGGQAPELSMAHAHARSIDLTQGELTRTGATFDFAIQGEGFFLLETPGGERMTRAGSFTPNADGELVSTDGHRLLDAGGAPVFVPAQARDIALAQDGTRSADGLPLAQIGVVRPLAPETLLREGGALFASDAGIEPVEAPVLLQGFIEGSNVSPVMEIARMIEVQRAYELGQAFLQREDERARTVLQTLGR